jgi:hypothetical protein
MAEVLRRSVRFVLTIAGHRRPGELERQENEQENGKPVAHAADINRVVSNVISGNAQRQMRAQ